MCAKCLCRKPSAPPPCLHALKTDSSKYATLCHTTPVPNHTFAIPHLCHTTPVPNHDLLTSSTWPHAPISSADVPPGQ